MRGRGWCPGHRGRLRGETYSYLQRVLDRMELLAAPGLLAVGRSAQRRTTGRWPNWVDCGHVWVHDRVWIRDREKQVVGFVPARGGPRGLPRKNLSLLAGKPLIAHAIEAAQSSNLIDRVVVSTDDAEIADDFIELKSD